MAGISTTKKKKKRGVLRDASAKTYVVYTTPKTQG